MMQAFTTMRIKLDKDQDYALTMHQAKLAKLNLKKAKADLVVKYMMIGLLQEDEKLNEYLK